MSRQQLPTAMLFNASVTAPKMVNGAISRVLVDQNAAADLWSNVALGAGYNLVSGFPDVSATVDNNVCLLWSIQACASVVPTAGAYLGWALYIDSVLVARPGRVYGASGTFSVSGGSGILAWGQAGAPAAGSHTFGVRFYANVAQSSGAYLRCGSAPENEFLRLTVVEVRA
jgi:hypothetical protein